VILLLIRAPRSSESAILAAYFAQRTPGIINTPDSESPPHDSIHSETALAEAARDIEARPLGVYRASREELEGIDAGLADLKHWRIASPEVVAALRARLRAT
jgi:hypothetical protein